MNIEQGHCYLADLNPPRKSKPGKVRPVVVIQSSDTIEAGSPGIVVIPLTTKIMPENILRVRIQPGKELDIKKISDILLDQIHTIDRSLIIQDLGPILHSTFEKIQDGIRFLLKL